MQNFGTDLEHVLRVAPDLVFELPSASPLVCCVARPPARVCCVVLFVRGVWSWGPGRESRDGGLFPGAREGWGLRRTGSLATVRPPLSLPHVHHPRYVLYAWGGL